MRFSRSIPFLLLSILTPTSLFAIPGDADNDGLRDEVETSTGTYVSPTNTGTSPNVSDTDGDSMPDGMEVNVGTNPVDADSKVKRPNIIYILADDLGYGDVGCFWQNQRTGSGIWKIQTPNLDAMAAEGAMMTHHYVGAPVCASSRASFLEGRNQGNASIRDNQFDFPLPNNHNVASVLKSAGYRTVHIGKAGLAGQLANPGLTSSGLAAHPLKRGFDRFFGYLRHNDGHEHYPRNGTAPRLAVIHDDYTPVKDAYVDLFTSDAWTGFAKKTIIDETTHHPDRPFFLYLSYDTPHFYGETSPTAVYPQGKGISGGIQWTGAPSYVNTATNDPAKVDNPTNKDSSAGINWYPAAQKYVSMIRRMDDSVADILQTLRDLGIDNNTLVVFTSDNGPAPTEVYPPSFQSYAGFEGIKMDLWEGGIRVPTIAWWPGTIPATNNPGNIRKITHPSVNYDWLATFADLARIQAPSISDGFSQVPVLTNQGTQTDRGYLYFEYTYAYTTDTYPDFTNHGGETRGQMQAIRIGDFMGVRYNIASASDPFRIYNVVTDTKQGFNLATNLPDLQERMKHLSVSARRPGTWPRPYDTALIPPVNPGATTSGLRWKAYEGNWPWLPEFRNLAPVSAGNAPLPSPGPLSRINDAGLVFEGYLSVPSSGSYTFQLSSNSNACLWIHDGLVIDNDYIHASTRLSTPVYLAAGFHPLRLYYRHQSGTPSLDLRYSGLGIPLQTIPASAFFSDGPQPTFSLQADTALTNTGNPVLIDALANDSGNYPLTLSSAGPVPSGTAAINSGKILYTPATGFFGSTTFPYTVTGGAASATSTVTADVLFDDEIWIPLDEGDGNTVRAISATSLSSGTLGGAADPSSSWIPGKSGSCLSFDGVDDEAEFPGMPLPTGSAPRTFTFWVRCTAEATSEYMTLFSYGGNSSTGQRFTLRLNNVPGVAGSRPLRFEVNGGVAVGTQPVNDGAWHHVALVLSDRDNDGKLKTDDTLFYIDGFADPIAQLDPKNISTLPGYPPTLGGSSHAANYNFKGEIDDVRVFPRALSATEISTLTASAPPPPSTVDTDTDGDGATDVQEAIAGTNPGDAHSHFHVHSFTRNENGMSLQWDGVPGRTYRVEESFNLNTWTLVPGVAPVVVTASSPDLSVEVPANGAPKRYLRMQVMLTP